MVVWGCSLPFPDHPSEVPPLPPRLSGEIRAPSMFDQNFIRQNHAKAVPASQTAFCTWAKTDYHELSSNLAITSLSIPSLHLLLFPSLFLLFFFSLPLFPASFLLVSLHENSSLAGTRVGGGSGKEIQSSAPMNYISSVSNSRTLPSYICIVKCVESRAEYWQSLERRGIPLKVCTGWSSWSWARLPSRWPGCASSPVVTYRVLSRNNHWRNERHK